MKAGGGTTEAARSNPHLSPATALAVAATEPPSAMHLPRPAAGREATQTAASEVAAGGLAAAPAAAEISLPRHDASCQSKQRPATKGCAAGRKRKSCPGLSEAAGDSPPVAAAGMDVSCVGAVNSGRKKRGKQQQKEGQKLQQQKPTRSQQQQRQQQRVNPSASPAAFTCEMEGPCQHSAPAAAPVTLLPASKSGSAAALGVFAASSSGSALEEAGVISNSAAAAPPLGPAALAIVKQELGAFPSQQQQKYWQLADLPYDAAELSQLVEHYLLPYIALRHVAHESRSGKATRETQLLVPVGTPRVQQHYPVLAPAVLQLYEQLQEEQGQGQEQQQKKRRRHQQRQYSSSSFLASPSSERLLLVLRCLCLWGRHQVQEQQLPSLLQGLLSRARAATADGGVLGGMGDADVQEVVDLTGEDDDDKDEVPEELLERFLAGECEVMLVRVVAGRGEQRGMKVKAELEGKG